MLLKIIPNKGFSLGPNKFHWNENRDTVRKKLNFSFTKDDRIIDLAYLFDGNESSNIDQKRDIYQNVNNSKNYFFLNYNEHNCLEELEVHSGLKIMINDLLLEFNKDIQTQLQELQNKGHNYIKLEEGNYLFKGLKITIASSESCGGEGNGLSYLYASNSINHLTEE